MAINPQFWNNKRVLITGDTGFKGSWLSLWLHSLGAKVSGYALTPPTAPNLFNLIKLNKHIHHMTGDIGDAEKLNDAFASTTPEIVIHMAAQSLVRASYSNPVETYATNVMGTINVLEAIRQSKTVKAGIIVTSDKCYENREQEKGYTEKDAIGGYDPYSSSKGCAELVTASYLSSFFNKETYNQHGVAIASARAGNVIGGGDWATDRLIPDAIKSLSIGQPIVLRNPHAIRPWQHVLDPLSAYLRLAEQLVNHGQRFSGAWNFGPEESEARTVEWITDRLVNQWGDAASYIIQANNQNPHEAHTLKLDCTKAKNELNWHPKWNVETAIARTSDWYQEYFANANMYDYCLSEIKDYQE